MKESHDERFRERSIKKESMGTEAQVQQRKANEMCDSVT